MVPNMESNVTYISDMDSGFEEIWKGISFKIAQVVGNDADYLKLAFKDVFYEGAMYELKSELTRQKRLLKENDND